MNKIWSHNKLQPSWYGNQASNDTLYIDKELDSFCLLQNSGSRSTFQSLLKFASKYYSCPNSTAK
jgi:hypothetical protein